MPCELSAGPSPHHVQHIFHMPLLRPLDLPSPLNLRMLSSPECSTLQSLSPQSSLSVYILSYESIKESQLCNSKLTFPFADPHSARCQAITTNLPSQNRSLGFNTLTYSSSLLKKPVNTNMPFLVYLQKCAPNQTISYHSPLYTCFLASPSNFHSCPLIVCDTKKP